jgi:uncharacterized DUF497 family protein
MDNRPVVWDHPNRTRIEANHPERAISSPEVEEALDDPERKDVEEQRAAVTYHNVLGMTNGGRLLLVVWVDDPRGRYPVHSRQASRRLARRYYT